MSPSPISDIGVTSPLSNDSRVGNARMTATWDIKRCINTHDPMSAHRIRGAITKPAILYQLKGMVKNLLKRPR